MEETTTEAEIVFENVSLHYDLHYDKTNTIKELVINLLKGRTFVSKKKEKLRALDGIDLTIKHGERVGIIGLNGAGKSTLLKVISRLLVPTSGSIKLSGHVQPLIEVGAGFNHEFSGRENIYLNGAMLGFTKRQIKEKEQEIIEFSELEKFIDVPVKYYSSGMVVRLAFSIATIVNPEILVLDEMLSAGDISFIGKAKQRMANLMDDAKIMVLVSHDLALVQATVNRLLVMSHGKIVYDGDVEDGLKYYKGMAEGASF